jgi:hypothetical protein
MSEKMLVVAGRDGVTLVMLMAPKIKGRGLMNLLGMQGYAAKSADISGQFRVAINSIVGMKVK